MTEGQICAKKLALGLVLKSVDTWSAVIVRFTRIKMIVYEVRDL